MRHRFTQGHINKKVTPFRDWSFRAKKFVLSGIVVFVVSVGYFLTFEGHTTASLVVLAIVMICLAPIGWLLFKAFRLIWPESLWKSAAFEIDGQGVWRTSLKGREMLISKRDVASIAVHRSSNHEIFKLTLIGRKHTVEVQGLVSSEAFLVDLMRMFPDVPVING
jgi:hypothetical protein